MRAPGGACLRRAYAADINNLDLTSLDGLQNKSRLTTLNLAGCRMLTNPRLLQPQANRTVLDLRRYDGRHDKT